MSGELETRYPNENQFLFYSAVNNGFITSANVTTNETLRRLQLSIVDHYRINLSPSGSLPATHYGARGLVRKGEADVLQAYYNAITRNSIDAWLLLPDGRRIWTKKDGWIDPPDGPWDYNAFLADGSPPKQIIRGEATDTSDDFLALWVIAKTAHVPWANNQVEDVTDDSWDHVLAAFSPTGELPPTMFAAERIVLPKMIGPVHTLAEIKSEFPLTTSHKAKVFVTDKAGALMIYNNEVGDINPPQPVPWSASFGEVESVLPVLDYQIP